jgi:glycosyltransferase involved in cell wall biosynthesis
MTAPFFSIIVPVYNTGKYLKKCIDSLINQTFSNIEVICVDDGSTDNSPGILESYNDERLVILRQEHNGVSKARNRGLEIARSDYILFADSDDYVSLDMCHVLYEIIRDKNPDLVVFGGQCFYHESFPENSDFWTGVFNAFNDILETRNITYLNDSIHALFNEKGAYHVVWTKCIKREIIEKNHIRFSELLNIAEDRTFCFCLFPCVNSITFIDNKFYYYQRNRPDSATAIFFPDPYPHEQQNFNSMLEVYAFWNALCLFPEYQIEFIQFFRSILFNDILSIKNQRQREEEARRLLDFFNTTFSSYAFSLITELSSSPGRGPAKSPGDMLKRALRVLKSDGMGALLKKIRKFWFGND